MVGAGPPPKPEEVAKLFAHFSEPELGTDPTAALAAMDAKTRAAKAFVAKKVEADATQIGVQGEAQKQQATEQIHKETADPNKVPETPEKQEDLQARVDAAVDKETAELQQNRAKAEAELDQRIAAKRAELEKIKTTDGAGAEQKIAALRAQAQADMVQKQQALATQFGADHEKIKAETEAQQKQNTQHAEDEAKKATDEGESQAKGVEMTGQMLALNAKVMSDLKAATAIGQAEQKAQQAINDAGEDTDGQLRAEQYREAAQTAAEGMRKQGELDAVTIVEKARRQAQAIRAATKASADKVKQQAANMNMQLVMSLTTGLTTRAHELTTANQALDGEVDKAVARAKGEMGKGQGAQTAEVDKAIAALEKEKAAVLSRIDGDIQRKQEMIKYRADGLRAKLNAAGGNPSPALAALVDRQIGDIDRSSDDVDKGAARAIEQSQKRIDAEVEKGRKAVLEQGKKMAEAIDAEAATVVERLTRAADRQQRKMGRTVARELLLLQAQGNMQRDQMTGLADAFRGAVKDTAAAAIAGKGGLLEDMTRQNAAMDARASKLGEDLTGIETKDVLAEREMARQTADAFLEEMDDVEVDERKLLAMFDGKTPEEIKAIRKALEEKGKDLDVIAKTALDDDEMKELHAYERGDTKLATTLQLANADSGDELAQRWEEVGADIEDPEARAAYRAEVAEDYELQTGIRLGDRVKDDVDEDDHPDIAASVEEAQQAADAKWESKLDDGKLVDLRTKRKTEMIEAAAQIKGAMEGSWMSLEGATNEGKIHEVLANRSPEEIKVISEQFEALGYGNLRKKLEDELSGTHLELAKAALTGNQEVWAARSLELAADGMGTDTEGMKGTMDKITDPAARARLEPVFERLTGRKLDAMFEDEESGSDLQWLRTSMILDNDRRAGMLGAIEVAEELGYDKNTTKNRADIYAALDRARTPEARAILLQECKGLTGMALEHRANYAVPEIRAAVDDFIAGDMVAYRAHKMMGAVYHTGADQKLAWKQMQDASPEERKEAIAYLEKATGKTFEEWADAELGGSDGEKMISLGRKGESPAWLDLKNAIAGWGTNTPDAKSALKRMTKDDVKRFEEETGESPETALRWEIGLSPEATMELMAYANGKPETPEEKIEQIKRLKAAKDAASASLTGMAASLTTDAGEDVSKRVEQVEVLEERLKAGGLSDEEKQAVDAQLDEHLAAMGAEVGSYKDAKKGISDTAMLGVKTAVAIASTIATAGGASPYLVALVGTGATISANAALDGGGYGLGQLGAQLAQGGIDLLTAGLGSQIGNPIVKGALTQLVGGLAKGAIDPSSLRDIDDFFANVAKSGGQGLLQGLAGGLVDKFAGDLFKTTVGPDLAFFASKRAAALNALVNAAGGTAMDVLTSFDSYQGKFDFGNLGQSFMTSLLKNLAGNLTSYAKAPGDLAKKIEEKVREEGDPLGTMSELEEMIAPIMAGDDVRQKTLNLEDGPSPEAKNTARTLIDHELGLRGIDIEEKFDVDEKTGRLAAQVMASKGVSEEEAVKMAKTGVPAAGDGKAVTEHPVVDVGEEPPPPAPAKLAEPNPAVLAAHGEEIETRRQALLDMIDGAANDSERHDLEREQAILEHVTRLDDPDLARMALETAETGDPDRQQKLLAALAAASGSSAEAAAAKTEIALLNLPNELARRRDFVKADPEALKSAQEKLGRRAELTPAERTALLDEAVGVARRQIAATMSEHGIGFEEAFSPENLAGMCDVSQGRIAKRLAELGIGGGDVVLQTSTKDEAYAASDKFAAARSHYFTVVHIGGQPYLVDPTFGQFLDKKAGGAGDVGRRLMASEEGTAVAESLTQSGYVPLTPEVAQLYGRALTEGDGSFSVEDYLKTSQKRNTAGEAELQDQRVKGDGSAYDEIPTREG